MEIKEVDFHKALLKYFENKYAGGTTFDTKPVQIIIQGLKELVKVEHDFSRQVEPTVHIGHLLGPFGFKIK